MKNFSVLAAVAFLAGCPRGSQEQVFEDIPCTLVTEGYGPAGKVPIRVEEVASGLEVPWALAFLPGGDVLVTERPGRIRLLRGGTLVAAPVATVPLQDVGTEGGLLGLVLHPAFAQNRLFFIYTAQATNEVQLWRLSPDATTASFERVVFGGIPSGDFHSGGRLRIGPDGMLYVSTGDAKQPDLAQDLQSPAGKLLRLTPEGDVPADNPFPDSRTYLLGIRNVQGFDWSPDGRLYVADHGPTGEFLLTGLDEINLASAGDNLGWPDVHGCKTADARLTPSLVWDSAAPPGGAAVYRADLIPEWKGSLLVATLGARHLHRVRFADDAPARVVEHDVYLDGQYGRLREVAMGPDGALWVTTTNCDSYGDCPPEKDRILRVAR